MSDSGTFATTRVPVLTEVVHPRSDFVAPQNVLAPKAASQQPPEGARNGLGCGPATVAPGGAAGGPAEPDPRQLLDGGGDSAAATSVSHAQASPPEAGVLEILPPALDETLLVQKVTADVQRRLDLLLEGRLREALERMGEMLMLEARGELASTLRDVVERAVAQELLRRHQQSPAELHEAAVSGFSPGGEAGSLL